MNTLLKIACEQFEQRLADEATTLTLSKTAGFWGSVGRGIKNVATLGYTANDPAEKETFNAKAPHAAAPTPNPGDDMVPTGQAAIKAQRPATPAPAPAPGEGGNQGAEHKADQLGA